MRARALLGGAIATVAALLCGSGSVLHAQGAASNPYRNHAALVRAVDSLRAAHPRIVTVTTIGQSPGGRAVQAIRIGAGDNLDGRPALLVLANAWGPHVVGSEIALVAASRLAAGYGADTAITRLLDRVTFYVIPRANPDAAESMWASPLVERTRNESAYDDDRDTMTDEDAPDDLDGNGVITMMRVLDPSGPWMADSADPALLRRADATKGEAGTYQLYVEGRDDDHDEQWNEDPPGGTDIAKNFSYEYDWFGEGSGLHQYSAPESRAIAEFFVAHPGISAVYVLGAQDNLVTPWTWRQQTGISGNPTGTSQGGPLQSILRDDQPWYAEMSRRYREITGITKGPPGAPSQGDPLSFAYFDMGRLAFGSTGWSVPDAPASAPARADSSGAAAASGAARAGSRGGGASARGASGGGGNDPLERERNALRWMRANRPDGFVEWTRVQHPDFPGRTVEVGGFRPFALINPPAAELAPVLDQQTAFITALAGMLPSVALRDVRVAQVGDGVYRVSAQVANNGFLPTNSGIGMRVDWPLRVRVTLAVGNGQHIASGRAQQLLPAIRGSGNSREVSWLVVGAPGSTVTIRATSPVSGDASETVTLRAR